METMNTALIVRDEETGFSIRRSYQGGSGFLSVEGIRQFGSLTIREGVVKGVASTFLTSVKVFDANNTLILDMTFDKLTGYTRRLVQRTIRKQLIEMLREAASIQNRHFDEDEIYEKIDSELNMVFFSESYKAIMNWADELGLLIN
jgi:hypothetical protein